MHFSPKESQLLNFSAKNFPFLYVSTDSCQIWGEHVSVICLTPGCETMQIQF